METAHAFALEGAPHGTAVVAERQTAGRGTRGRLWIADAGGLWLSVIARPERVDAFEAIALRVGLAVAAALEARFPHLPALALKWPNDLLLDGRKLAGILCEARWAGDRCQWIVVGLGVNVDNAIRPALAERAARLGDWIPAARPEPLAEPLAAAVAGAAREAGPLARSELAAFAARDALRGRRVLGTQPGLADGITPGGALRIVGEDGTVREALGGVVTALD